MEADLNEYRLVRGAWIHSRARLPEDPKDIAIEPGVVIGPDVEIGPGTWIGAGAVLYGPTRIGEKNQIWPQVVLGGAPQDISYAGQPTRLEIGNRNVFREGVTVHRASTKGECVTRVGDDNFFMASSHIGHDSVVGNRVIFANSVLIGGHCHIESFANIAGAVAVAQFVTVGKYSFICGTCGVRKDAEPFIAHDKVPPGESGATCINEVGLRRNGFSRETIQKLRTAFKLLFLKDEATLDLVKVRAEIQTREAACQEVEDLLAFVERKRKGRFGRQLQ